VTVRQKVADICITHFPLQSSTAVDSPAAVVAVVSQNVSTQLSFLSSDLSFLRGSILAHDDRLFGVDALLRDGTKAVRDNHDRLIRLSEKVDYFRQNVLKVKKLPAMMNALERRIEALDENLLKLLDASVDEEDDNLLVYEDAVYVDADAEENKVEGGAAAEGA
jgi:hypothetical protein